MSIALTGTERPGGMASHESPVMQTEAWLTPPHVLEALGPFDLDPCAPAVRPWPMAAAHYTKADDGLAQPWHGRVWLNPPYGRQTVLWLRRMTVHGCGTALIFARTETAMFFETVWSCPTATAALFLRGRLCFLRADGAKPRGPAHCAGAPSVLVAYGQADADALAACGLPGRLVALR